MSTTKAIELEEIGLQDEIKLVPVEKIKPNDWNPNEMDPELFNRLVRDIEETGFLQTITVAPYNNPDEPEIDFIILDGEHRWEAMRQAGFSHVPVVVARGVKDEADMIGVTVRMNKIRGRNNIKKLVAAMERVARERELSEAADLFIMEDDEFEELIRQHREMITDPDLRQEFDRRVASGEVKTVEDLTRILNELFRTYGDTLPANFMILDFGGKRHIWVRLQKSQYKQIWGLAQLVRARGYTFDSLVAGLLSSITEEQVDQLIEGGKLTPMPDEVEEWFAEVGEDG